MELYINELWLFVTAVIFTIVGYYWGLKASVVNISEAVIDSLIEQEFLKVQGTGKDMVIIKHTEWCEKESN